MENVAHTLAGLLLAEAAIVSRRAAADPARARFSKLAYGVSAVANNLPDADQVYTSVTGGKLGYLLHHRGHTHTLPIGIALGLLVAWVAIGFARRRSPLQVGDAPWLIGLGAMGAVVHMTMDAWNVYGVHPFWPVYDGWIYGDAVFIVEPLFWLLAMPALFFAARRRWWKITLACLFVAIVAVSWIAASFVPLPVRVGLTVVAALSVLVARQLGPRTRPVFGLAGFAVVVLGFLSASHRARSLALEGTRGGEALRTLDLALSPFPANPFCFTGQLVQVEGSAELVVTRLTVAPFASLFPAARCPATDDSATAPLVRSGFADSRALQFHDAFRGSVPRLRELARDHCEVAAALEFIRVPYWLDEPDSLIVGDLRFDRSTGLDFADLELARVPASCPRFVPGWTPPRSDLLR